VQGTPQCESGVVAPRKSTRSTVPALSCSQPGETVGSRAPRPVATSPGTRRSRGAGSSPRQHEGDGLAYLNRTYNRWELARDEHLPSEPGFWTGLKLVALGREVPGLRSTQPSDLGKWGVLTEAVEPIAIPGRRWSLGLASGRCSSGSARSVCTYRPSRASRRFIRCATGADERGTAAASEACHQPQFPRCPASAFACSRGPSAGSRRDATSLSRHSGCVPRCESARCLAWAQEVEPLSASRW
jgi:hypothetical protein